MMEAIRSTEPGVKEYQLETAARYVFIVNGARMDAYRSITAAGNVNINNMHYFRNSDELRDGDWVLMDYAPDFRYYVSDIGRMWPVNGTYAPWPGLVFSVDPQLRVRSEGIYVRYEDTVVVTEKGVENFTDFLPSELAALEKLTREKGIVQMFPALIELPERFQIKR